MNFENKTDIITFLLLPPLVLEKQKRPLFGQIKIKLFIPYHFALV